MKTFREKIGTITLAILGACNKVMSVFMPIGLALLMMVSYPNLTQTNLVMLIGIATLSSLFRAINIWID